MGILRESSARFPVKILEVQLACETHSLSLSRWQRLRVEWQLL